MPLKNRIMVFQAFLEMNHSGERVRLRHWRLEAFGEAVVRIRPGDYARRGDKACPRAARVGRPGEEDTRVSSVLAADRSGATLEGVSSDPRAARG